MTQRSLLSPFLMLPPPSTSLPPPRLQLSQHPSHGQLDAPFRLSWIPPLPVIHSLRTPWHLEPLCLHLSCRVNNKTNYGLFCCQTHRSTFGVFIIATSTSSSPLHSMIISLKATCVSAPVFITHRLTPCLELAGCSINVSLSSFVSHSPTLSTQPVDASSLPCVSLPMSIRMPELSEAHPHGMAALHRETKDYFLPLVS